MIGGIMDKYEKDMERAGYIRLTREHLLALQKHDYCYVEVEPGNFKRFTTKEIYFNKEEIEDFIEGVGRNDKP